MGKNLIRRILAVVLTLVLALSSPIQGDSIKAAAITHNGVTYQIMSYDEVMSKTWDTYEYQCDSERFLALVKLVNHYGYKEYQVGFDWVNEIDGYLYAMAGFTHPLRQEIYFAPETSFFTEIHETGHAIYALFGYPKDLVDYTMDNQTYNSNSPYRYGDEDEAMADALAYYFLGQDTEEAHAKMDKYVEKLVAKAGRIR